MRVVLDTNVLISAFLTVTGTSQHVFATALKRHTIIVSDYILGELRERLLKKLGVPVQSVESLISFLRKRAVILDVELDPKVAFGDKKDIPVLNLVVNSAAHYFITGDKKILALKKTGGALILSPREALEVL